MFLLVRLRLRNGVNSRERYEYELPIPCVVLRPAARAAATRRANTLPPAHSARQHTMATDAEAAQGKTTLVVNGVRYAIPYDRRRLHSVKAQFLGLRADVVLGSMFRLQRGLQDLEEATEHWRGEIEAGRVRILRHRRLKEDKKLGVQPLSPSALVLKGDRLEIFTHVRQNNWPERLGV